MAATSSSSDNFRATPQELYNDLGKTYEDAYVKNEGQKRSLQWLLEQLPKRATVLDMGCGTGRPASKTLSDAGMIVTGVDLSPVMLSLARASVPAATFIEGDLLTFVPEGQVDAIVAYYSLIGHVSQNQIQEFFVRVHGFLEPGGYFIFGSVPLEGNEVMTEWMDKKLPCSGFSTENTLAKIKGAGLEVLKYEETMFKPTGREARLEWGGQVYEEPHLFVYARKSEKQ